MSDALKRDGADLVVTVRLTPRGGRDAVDRVKRLDDGRAVIAARVRAAPEDGKANSALIELVADAAGVSKSSVTLVAGATARLKTLRIAGADEKVEARMRKAIGG